MPEPELILMQNQAQEVPWKPYEVPWSDFPSDINKIPGKAWIKNLPGTPNYIFYVYITHELISPVGKFQTSGTHIDQPVSYYFNLFCSQNQSPVWRKRGKRLLELFAGT